MDQVSYRLLKSQQNEILILIKEAGLDPFEFQWEEFQEPRLHPLDKISPCFHRLIHKPSGFAALFEDQHLRYSPALDSTNAVEYTVNWAEMYLVAKRWLTYLKRELETPDLWASLSQEQEMLGVEPAEAVNTPFNAKERIQVKLAIEEIRIYIASTYSLADEPLAKVNRKLDYLIDASTRLGRIDWKNLFVGALISLAVQHLTPSSPGLRELLGTAWHLLRHVLGSVISPPLLH